MVPSAVWAEVAEVLGRPRAVAVRTVGRIKAAALDETGKVIAFVLRQINMVPAGLGIRRLDARERRVNG